jgi:hypothetical protein
MSKNAAAIECIEMLPVGSQRNVAAGPNDEKGDRK